MCGRAARTGKVVEVLGYLRRAVNSPSRRAPGDAEKAGASRAFPHPGKPKACPAILRLSPGCGSFSSPPPGTGIFRLTTLNPGV